MRRGECIGRAVDAATDVRLENVWILFICVVSNMETKVHQMAVEIGN